MNHNRLHRSSRSGMEKTSSAKSTNRADVAHSSLLSPWVLAALLAAGGFAIAPAWAQTESYDGSINRASASSLNLPEWLVPGNKWGLLHGSGSGTVSGATLIVDYTTAPTPEFAIGGYSASGITLGNNTVILRQGEVDGPVYGGLSHHTLIKPGQSSAGSAVDTSASLTGGKSATAGAQTVVVETGGATTGNVYGAAAVIWAQAGNASATSTNPNDTAHATASAFATTSAAQSSDSEVRVAQGASLDGELYGGMASITAQAANANASAATAKAEAGANSSQANANDHEVNIGPGTTLSGDLYGGRARITAQAANATATNTFTTYAYANANANAAEAHANDSEVNIGQGASLRGNLYGGRASIAAQAAEATDTGNGVNASAFAYAYANEGSNAQASNNTVRVAQGVKLDSHLYGGRASIAAQADKATANASASNADARAPANTSESTAQASSNAVTIAQGAELGGHLYGGMASLFAHGGTAITENGQQQTGSASVNVADSSVLANDNTIDFNSMLQAGNIYGGYVEFDVQAGTLNGAPGSKYSAGSQAQATGNTITIGEFTQFTGTTLSLYGGYQTCNPGFTPESYDVFSGNTLNYAATNTTQLQTLANFEYLNFTLTPALANSTTALITAQDAVLGANSDNTSSGVSTPTQVAVIDIHSGNILSVGNTFVLVNAANMTGGGNGSQHQVTQPWQGTTLYYDVETTVNVAQGTITATILGCQTSTGGVCPASNPSTSTPIPTLPIPLLLALVAAVGLLGRKRLDQRA